jgi:hypothetical protein
MEKFRIGNVAQFGRKGDAHDHVKADRVLSRDRPREWVQIRCGPLCEQSPDTVV